MITVIWLIALMSVIALGGVILSSNEYKISMDQVKLKQAYYLAEAGLEEGLNTLRVSPAQEISIQENLDGTITVKQQSDLTERIKLEAIGTSEDIKKT